MRAGAPPARLYTRYPATATLSLDALHARVRAAAGPLTRLSLAPSAAGDAGLSSLAPVLRSFPFAFPGSVTYWSAAPRCPASAPRPPKARRTPIPGHGP